MLQKIWHILLVVFLIICLFCGCTLCVSADSSDDRYSYWYGVSSSNKSVYSKAMYVPTEFITAQTIGLNSSMQISNIATDENNIYILTNDSQIIILDKNFKLIRKIGLIDGKESYNDAKSIYVYKDSTIYICDTAAHRILHITQSAKLIEIITLPESQLIPEDFNFLPTRLVKDDYGYLYVLSDGSYYGALIYDENGEFSGFYGANTVTTTFSGVLTNIKNRMFPNNEKLSKMTQKLPFSFVDLDIDSKGFIYTCNGYTDTSDRKGKIRKLTPGKGSDVLGSSNVIFTDYDLGNYLIQDREFNRHNLIDLGVDSNGFIYALEKVYGKVYVYDDECHILNVIGGGMGEGSQLGNFTEVNGLALVDDGEKILVSDSQTNGITVFEINSFGKDVKNLINLTSDGDYKEAKEGWIKLISTDRNFQPAYSGLAKVYLSEKNYESAIYYAKLGYDKEVYSSAFEYIRRDFIDKNFVWIFTAAILLLIGGIALIVVCTRKNIVFIKNKEVRLMLSTPFHPSNNFTLIKEKGFGSLTLSVLLMILFYVVTVQQTISGGFMFTVYDPASFNSIWVLVRTIGLVLLWIIANWMVCTLLGGNGKFKEIIIITCYSLIPLIVAKTINIILTNILLPSEAAFLGILDVVAFLYFALMLVIGLLKIHDFSLTRLIGTTVLSILGIAAIVFFMILFFILGQQFVGFIATLIAEIYTL